MSLTPAKLGLEPSAAVMVNVSAGIVFKTLLGSLRSLRVSSPVLVSVVTTFKFSTPFTTFGPVTWRESPGAAKTADAVAARTKRAARRDVQNMVWAESGGGG